MECGVYSTYDPPRSFGDLLFVITYRDGEKELLGFVNLGYVTPDGVSHYSLDFLRNKEELYNIFLKYADKETLLEVSKDFSHFPYWYKGLEDTAN